MDVYIYFKDLLNAEYEVHNGLEPNQGMTMRNLYYK